MRSRASKASAFAWDGVHSRMGHELTSNDAIPALDTRDEADVLETPALVAQNGPLQLVGVDMRAPVLQAMAAAKVR